VIVAERGSFEDQIERTRVEEPLPPAFVPRVPSQTYPELTVPPPDLKFFNGLGGFHQGGREYVTLLARNNGRPRRGPTSSATPSILDS
jgi:cyclic beta-1,2-glucan synthetase